MEDPGRAALSWGKAGAGSVITRSWAMDPLRLGERARRASTPRPRFGTRWLLAFNPGRKIYLYPYMPALLLRRLGAAVFSGALAPVHSGFIEWRNECGLEGPA